MVRKTSKQFNIGDKFLSWEVVECVEPKKYRFLCRCSCGNERVFYKYNLLKGSYAPCKSCGYSKLANTSAIKKHWNCELNGALFTKPHDFSLTQSYWFICDKGHNFKSSIKDFKLDRCLGCKNKTSEDSSKTQTIEFALQLFSSFCNDIVNDDNFLFVSDLNLAISFNEIDRFDSYRNYFDSEEALIKEITTLKTLENKAKEKGYNYVDFKVEKSLDKNVDTLKQLMVSLF